VQRGVNGPAGNEGKKWRKNGNELAIWPDQKRRFGAEQRNAVAGEKKEGLRALGANCAWESGQTSREKKRTLGKKKEAGAAFVRERPDRKEADAGLRREKKSALRRKRSLQ